MAKKAAIAAMSHVLFREAVNAEGGDVGIADTGMGLADTFMAKSSIALCRGVMSALR